MDTKTLSLSNFLLRAIPVALFASVLLMAQGGPAETSSFADISVIPGNTVVVVRDPQGADQMIVTTFYWQKVAGIEKPIMRNITGVVPVIKDSAVATDGAQNPADVATVHVSLVKITSRLEWHPAPVAEKAKEPCIIDACFNPESLTPKK